MIADVSSRIVSEVQSVRHVWQVLAWEKPYASGAVLSCILALVLVFGVLEYTVLTFVCRLLQFLFAVVGGLTSMKKMTVTSDDVKITVSNGLTKLQPSIVSAIDCLYRIVTWENVSISGYVFAGCLLVSFLSCFLSDLTIIVLVTFVSFTAPYVLAHHQKEVGQIVDRFKEAFHGLISQLELQTKKAKKE